MPMFDFIKIQYKLGHIDAARVRAYAPRYITAEQAEEILR